MDSDETNGDELIEAVMARLSRAQPLNADTQRVLTELRSALSALTRRREGPRVSPLAALQAEVKPSPKINPIPSSGEGGFDRRAYQRAYMKAYRRRKREGEK